VCQKSNRSKLIHNLLKIKIIFKYIQMRNNRYHRIMHTLMCIYCCLILNFKFHFSVKQICLAETGFSLFAHKYVQRVFNCVHKLFIYISNSYKAYTSDYHSCAHYPVQYLKFRTIYSIRKISIFSLNLKQLSYYSNCRPTGTIIAVFYSSKEKVKYFVTVHIISAKGKYIYFSNST